MGHTELRFTKSKMLPNSSQWNVLVMENKNICNTPILCHLGPTKRNCFLCVSKALSLEIIPIIYYKPVTLCCLVWILDLEFIEQPEAMLIWCLTHQMFFVFLSNHLNVFFQKPLDAVVKCVGTNGDFQQSKKVSSCICIWPELYHAHRNCTFEQSKSCQQQMHTLSSEANDL